jgi:proline iminopeptidase
MTPDEFTNQELMLEVGDGHTLYVQDWGNKVAKLPVILLHGGPGSHCKPHHRRPFDPTKQRVIFFDQRGCGQSTPYGSLDHNTTADIVEDISKIATKLGIDKFILTGGSWGSCLALAYALAHPERVSSMVLHGIFTGSQSEIDWLEKGRFANFFPDAWERYLQATPKANRTDPGVYHYQRIMSDDPKAVAESGLAYETLEGSTAKLDDRTLPADLTDYDPAGIRIEMHYMHKRCFMPDNHILDNAQKLTMPVHLVQGRYDMVCPPITAYELAKRLPDATLSLTVSGHHAEHETDSLLRLLLRQVTEEK